MRIGVDVFTQSTKSYTTGIQRVLRETHENLLDWFGIRNIEVVPVQISKFPRRYDYLSDSYLRQDPLLLLDDVQLEQVDHLVILDISLAINARQILDEKRKRPSFKVTTLIHDILPMSNPEWFPEESPPHFRRFLQIVNHISDQLIFTSHSQRRAFERMGWQTSAELRVVPLGTHFAPRSPSTNETDSISMIYVSTIEPRKGHDLAIDVLEDLLNKGLYATLTLVGKAGWLSGQIIERIQNHSRLGANLFWYPDADDRRVLNLASNCELGIMPAQNEGFGLFLEESLSMGLKTVVSDIDVFRERSFPNLFFSARTTRAFVDTILEAKQTCWVEFSGLRNLQDFGYEFAEAISSIVEP